VLKNIFMDVKSPEQGCNELLKAWSNDSIKIVVIEPNLVLNDVKAYYESLFPLLGSPAKLAEDASIIDRNSQRNGAVWMEIRFDPKIKDAYRHSSEAQPLHTDGSYIPDFPNSSLLCCVANAGEGGETVFIDAAAVVSILEKEDKELFDFLSSTIVPHSRSGDTKNQYVIYNDNNIWRVNWNYFCVENNLDVETLRFVERFHLFLKNNQSINSQLLSVKLQPGQAVLWKDNEVFHGRNSFSAVKESERFIWKCAFDVGNFN
jgi:alpha-ketoglutarate-dependent taurine dioxygenase